jgi:Photosynthetic reaction centre cytochrome C subunit
VSRRFRRPQLRLCILFVLSVLVPFALGQESGLAPALPEPVTPQAIAQANSAALAAARRTIVGRQNQPAETVFRNIKVMKGIPAGRMLAIMDTGFSRSLGVSCAHCHTAWLFQKDDKPAKQIARDMWGMTGTINNDLLKKISGLKDRDPIVNCTSCHRGQLKPATELKLGSEQSATSAP